MKCKLTCCGRFWSSICIWLSASRSATLIDAPSQSYNDNWPTDVCIWNHTTILHIKQTFPKLQQNPPDLNPTKPSWSRSNKTLLISIQQNPPDLNPTKPSWSQSNKTLLISIQQNPPDLNPTISPEMFTISLCLSIVTVISRSEESDFFLWFDE